MPFIESTTTCFLILDLIYFCRSNVIFTVQNVKDFFFYNSLTLSVTFINDLNVCIISPPQITQLKVVFACGSVSS